MTGITFVACKINAGAHGDWCPSRTSNPVLGARTTLGGFDSHTFPPFYCGSAILSSTIPASVYPNIPGITIRLDIRFLTLPRS